MKDSSNNSKPVKISDKAVALEYNQYDELPRVNAKGAGYIAEKIVQIAEENDITVTENAPLAETLAQLSVGEQLESNTAELLVEALCFLYHIELDFTEDKT